MFSVGPSHSERQNGMQARRSRDADLSFPDQHKETRLLRKSLVSSLYNHMAAVPGPRLRRCVPRPSGRTSGILTMFSKPSFDVK